MRVKIWFSLCFFLYFNSGLYNLGSRSTKQPKWVSLFQLSSTFFKTSNSKNMGLSPLEKTIQNTHFLPCTNFGVMLKFRLNNSKFKILFSEVSVRKSKFGDNNLKCWLLNLKAIVFPAAETGFHRLICSFRAAWSLNIWLTETPCKSTDILIWNPGYL